jgi:hypothetical protein
MNEKRQARSVPVYRIDLGRQPVTIVSDSLGAAEAIVFRAKKVKDPVNKQRQGLPALLSKSSRVSLREVDLPAVETVHSYLSTVGSVQARG